MNETVGTVVSAEAAPFLPRRVRLSRSYTILTAAILSLLGFAILAFGAVEYWSVAILQIGLAMATLVWAAVQYRTGTLQVRPCALLAPAAGFGLLVLVQLVSDTSDYRYATYIEAQRWFGYALALWLASQVFTRARFSILKGAFSFFGFVLALFGIAQHLWGNEKLYWIREPEFGGAIFGPYVNGNHYAGAMELLFPFSVFAAMSTRLTTEKRLLFSFMALVMAGSVFLSGSRGGMIALIVEGLVIAGLAFLRGGRRLHAAVGILACVIVASGLVLWLDRYEIQSQAATLRSPLNPEVAGQRLIIVKDSLRMWRDRALTGFGLGTFPSVYPRYRSFSSDSFVNAAHNDYVQILVETGLFGSAFMLWFLVALFRGGLRHLRAWGRVSLAAVPSAAFVGCLGLVVHSFSDFNLRVPANAALFFTCAALACTRWTDEPANDL